VIEYKNGLAIINIRNWEAPFLFGNIHSLKLIPTENVGTGWKLRRAFSPRDMSSPKGKRKLSR
jgi:hypothetical protein